MRSAIVIVVDGLRPEYLGPYGKSWVNTPNLNRVAAQGVVFDRCLAATQDCSTLFRSLLTGSYPRSPAANPDGNRADGQSAGEFAGNEEAAPLIQMVRSQGGTSLFMTDDPRLSRDPVAGCFDVVKWLPGRAMDDARGVNSWEDVLGALPPRACSDWADTWTAGFFSQLSDVVTNLGGRPFLLWCHLAGFARVWDCPMEFREHYQEEGDPPPWNGISYPRHYFPPGSDPDAWLPFVQAYAAQVTILDLCLGGLLQALSLSGLEDESVLALTGFGGYPLAEHGWLGMWKMPPRNERVGCPLLIRLPSRMGAASRSQALCYPHDLAPSLLGAILDGNVQPIPGAGTTKYTFSVSAATPLKHGDVQESGPHLPKESDHEPDPGEAGVPMCELTDGHSLMPIIQGATETVRDRLFCVRDDPATVAIHTEVWSAIVDLTAVGHSWSGQLRGRPDTSGQQENSPFEDSFSSVEATSGASLGTTQGLKVATTAGGITDVAAIRRVVELYVKPDDRWEMNNVADRCPDVAKAAIHQAKAFAAWQRGHISGLPSLDRVLAERLV